MATERINVSLPTAQLRMLDAHVKRVGVSRSLFIGESVRKALLEDALAQLGGAGALGDDDWLHTIEADRDPDFWGAAAGAA
ncbi:MULTISPECIES: ribbon-helix-helix domain-containing protein [Thermomonospora]|uniref:Metal-responsive CopG/Arc/MetJ family transcriptional regulator n=1 Tax=Thermomonospora cellulosilytica TaxID=1411118 RepID=A0A7W3RBQ7_9ACTN|nr:MULTISPECIES: ribbon-helix-helix domain-containing protein [Thermomonospora]MBA9006480.1 metal-responsive CopG/Arc/MetJ family transcriptional regulator [Thermomonospora cellulosilytica]